MDFSDDSDNIDTLLNDLGGCGRFQFLVTFLISWIKIVSAMSMMMMAFGNYNPGWKCMDASLAEELNLTTADSEESSNDTAECRMFDKCTHVEFTPGINTIVSEWHLLCDRSWIASLIISIQMLGVFIGSYIAGYLGDKIGRKATSYGSAVYHIIVNVIAIFSNSWQMFAVMRFFIGLAIPIMMNLSVILAMEYAREKWRNAIMCFPLWTIGGLIFAISAWATEDWRYIHVINAVASLMCLGSWCWMPESLRWLMVKDRMKTAYGVTKNIAKLNRVPEESLERLHKISKSYVNNPHSNTHSFFQLLRRGARKSTVILGITCISLSSIYYAISFSVKSMPGSFYVNLLILFVSEGFMTPISITLPNYIGRKVSIIMFLTLGTVCLFGIVGLDLGAYGNLRTAGVLVCAIAARVLVDAAWDVTLTYIVEFYPTVIRGTSIAYASWIARIGGILAPYLIPDRPETYYISYLVMAILAFICCGLLLMLKDTKGKPLQETWEMKVEDPDL